MSLTVLDLFSGIGGFSLGLQRAGMRTVAFCEIDEFCRRVLAKHWPHVPIYEDVRDLTAARLRADGIEPDVVCGGFPCTDISLAGKGAGLEGEHSGLWREFARLVGELRPRHVLVENVGALRGRGLVDVLRDLASISYVGQAHAVPAAAVGAPHLRDRVWIIATDAADANGSRCERLRVTEHQFEQGTSRRELDGLGARGRREGPPIAANASAVGQRTLDPLACSGDEPGGMGEGGWSRPAPEPGRQRRQELRGLFGPLARSLTAAEAPWPRPAIKPLCRMDDGLPPGVDRRGWVRQERARLKALGNSVVPLIPQLMGEALLEVYGQ